MDVVTIHDPSVLAVKRAAMESEDFDAVAAMLQAPDLGQILSTNATLRQAFDRGRFLRRLRELATGPICVAVVAEHLGFDEPAFKAMLKKDSEGRDVWEQGRHTFYVRAKASLLRAAETGAASAVRAVERLLRDAGPTGSGRGSAAAGGFDHTHVAPTLLETITGVKRMQWARWTDAGLPRNPDGTFSLPAVFGWIRRNPRRASTRPYRQRPSAVTRRILQRVTAVLKDELERERIHEDDNDNRQ